MEEAQQTFVELLEKVAEEQGYAGCAPEVRALSSEGANMTCALFLATLRAPPRPDLRLFAKVAAMSDRARQLSPMRCPYTSELLYYTKFQKEFDAIQTKYAVPEEHRVRVPKLYGSRHDYLSETLVLDDLVAQGFRNYDRQQPASLEYVSAALELLAKFHALSLAYHRADPAGSASATKELGMDIVVNSIKCCEMRAMIPIMKPKARATALAAAADEHRARLQRFVDEEPCRFLQFTDMYRAKGRHILVHGDFKPSNIMHRRRNGKLELALVDFQLVRDGDPVEDLTYFLFTATDEHFRRQHRQAVLRRYHDQLAAALRRLDMHVEDVYPRALYEAQLEEHSMLGLLLALTVLPMVLVEEEKLPAVDSDEYEVTDFVVEASALYKDRLNGVLNNYVEWGLL